MTKLTPKQEAFVQAYLRTGNQGAAYREAYNADGMTANSIDVEAHRTLSHPKVALRVQQLQEKIAKKTEYTVESVAKMFQDVYDAAMRDGEDKALSAANSASMGIAKLHGLIVDKAKVHHTHEIVDVSDHELANIATGSGNRAIEAPTIEADSTRIH